MFASQTIRCAVGAAAVSSPPCMPAAWPLPRRLQRRTRRRRDPGDRRGRSADASAAGDAGRPQADAGAPGHHRAPSRRRRAQHAVAELRQLRRGEGQAVPAAARAHGNERRHARHDREAVVGRPAARNRRAVRPRDLRSDAEGHPEGVVAGHGHHRGDRRRRDDGQEGARRQGRQQPVSTDRGEHRGGALDAEGRQGARAGGPGVRLRRSPAAAASGSTGRLRARRGRAPAAGATAPPVVAPPAARVPPAGPSWQEQVVAKGWAYASLRPASIQADNGAGLTEGIIGLVNKGQPRKAGRLGRAEGVGLGHQPRSSTTSRPTRRWTRSASALEGPLPLRQGHRRRHGLRAAVRDGFISSSGAGGAKLIAATTASCSRTSRRRASTTGWPATSSSTPVR